MYARLSPFGKMRHTVPKGPNLISRGGRTAKLCGLAELQSPHPQGFALRPPAFSSDEGQIFSLTTILSYGTMPMEFVAARG